jgi:glycosyltransferase involved in cell wall biosynthesis
MKVVHLTRGLGDYVSGLVNAMAQICETHLVVCREDEWIQEYLDPKVTVFRSLAPRVRSLGNILSTVRIARYIAEIMPDVVHLQSGLLWELPLAKIFPGITFVGTIHDVTKHPAYTFRPHPHNLMAQIGNVVSGIIVHSPRLQVEASERFRLHAANNRIFVLPHGVITRYGIGVTQVAPRDGGRILLFGGLNKWKGIEYLIKAEPIIRSRMPHVKIRIAGASSTPDYHRKLLSEEQNIELWLGRQSDDSVRKLFEWADVLVLPYIQASQSGVLHLGMAFSVPPVVTSVGGLPDVVMNGRNGLVVEPHDVQGLADAVVRMLSDLDLRKVVIENLALEKETTYNWATIARQTISIYRQLEQGALAV